MNSLQKNNVQTGDVLFFSAKPWYKDPAAYVIKLVTNSNFVHCGFAYWLDDDLFVIESQYGIDRTITNGVKYIDRDITVVTPLVPWSINESLVVKTIDIVPYGYADLILVGVRTLLGKIGIKTHFKNYEGEICSEFVAKFNNIQPCNISPTELYDAMIAKGAIIKR
jgi:hypothetical protein